MNGKLIIKVLGHITIIEALCMIPSALVCLYYGDGGFTAMAASIAVCAAIGVPLSLIHLPPDSKIQLRDGYFAVALSWVFLSIFGSLPYIFGGTFPAIPDALFEAASGFTTTGASAMAVIEGTPKGILFWRSCTQWIGGMGILVMTIALLPKLGAGSVYLMRAESPGPIKTKMVPKISQNAKILYIIYIALTALEVLCLKIAGMPLYDSICHAMTTTSTGGFSTMNSSVAAYNSEVISWIIIVFMFLSSINFALLFAFIRRDFDTFWKSQELRFYFLAVAAAIGVITVSRLVTLGGAAGEVFSSSAFQVVSVVTTTGFATADYCLWPTLCQCIIMLMMLMGGCAGSTSGGLKSVRVLLLFKVLRREIKRIIHPRVVDAIRIDGHLIEESVLSGATLYFFIYILLIIIGSVIVSFDNLGFAESLSAALTCVSNVGPGLGAVGPVSNFSALGGFSKITLSFAMIFGRIEILPMLVLFTYPFAKHDR